MNDAISIEWNGTHYTLKDLMELPMAQLVSIHNEIGAQRELDPVERFAARPVGAKRTWDRLMMTLPVLDDVPLSEQGKHDNPVGEIVLPSAGLATLTPPEEDAPVQERALSEETVVPVQEPAPKKGGAERRKREMYFNFPVKSEIKPARPGTLRYRVLAKLLDGGLTFSQVIDEVKSFDADRRAAGVDMRGSDENPDRRAYEIVRIIHYYLGYGLRQSPEGVITAFDKK